MPLENERKFAIQFSREAEDFIAGLAESRSSLRQAYLECQADRSLRIRRQEGEEVRHWFTFKQRVGPDLVEIEQIISKEDFDRLSPLARQWVQKDRYCVGGWDVDFFREAGETYFALAEIELPEGVCRPEKVPDFISRHLIYAVPAEDRRFSSRKLSDVEYARRLLFKIERLAV